MKVKAAPGRLVPKEGNPREYIKDDQVENVERTAYYVRAVLCGDLVEVQDSGAVKRATKGGA